MENFGKRIWYIENKNQFFCNNGALDGRKLEIVEEIPKIDYFLVDRVCLKLSLFFVQKKRNKFSFLFCLHLHFFFSNVPNDGQKSNLSESLQVF